MKTKITTQKVKPDKYLPSHSLRHHTQEKSLHLKRKRCNLYCSVTGDWLTFTSPVEQRKRGGKQEGGMSVEVKEREGDRL